MRRTIQTCTAVILGGLLLSTVGCQSTGWNSPSWGSGSTWFSSWKNPWPGSTSLASTKTMPSSAATPSQPSSSVTNPNPSGYAAGSTQPAASVASNWGSNYPTANPGGSTSPYGAAPSGYSQPNSPYAPPATQPAGGYANTGYGGAPANYGANTGYTAQPAAYQQPAAPPAQGGYQASPYENGAYNPGPYNQAPASGGYNTGSTYNTNGGGGGYGEAPASGYAPANSFQGSQVEPPPTGYQPLSMNEGAPRGGGYQAAVSGDSMAPPTTNSGYAVSDSASPVNSAIKSGYQVQPVSAQEAIPSASQDYYAAGQPVAPSAGTTGVLDSGATLPSSLATPSGSYRPGSVGGSGQSYLR